MRRCCLCHRVIDPECNDSGHSAAPLDDGLWCAACYDTRVLRERIEAFTRQLPTRPTVQALAKWEAREIERRAQERHNCKRFGYREDNG